jgi:hypothetical protein
MGIQWLCYLIDKVEIKMLFDESQWIIFWY